jgi:membrane protease YdiL (CAAX protease family)
LVMFSLSYIVPSSELENIMASIVGRYSSLTKILIHLTQIPGPFGLFLAILSVAIIPSIVEEIFFRGLIQYNLIPKYGNMKSIITTSILFAVIHFNPSSIVPIFILSLVLGYVYYKTNNLLYSIIIHFSTNFITVFLSRYNSFGLSGLNPSNTGIEHVNLIIFIPFTLISVLAVYIIYKYQINRMLPDTTPTEPN